jgi:hypothetical protein
MAKKKKRLITEIRHPDYCLEFDDFYKWRLCYNSGDAFIHRYLQRFSIRESDPNYQRRLAMAYSPSFARAAINEIRNSIYQRMSEINRLGGPDNYQEAITGFTAGVDLHGSSMNAYIGQDVLTELMIMGKVGVIVDKSRIDDPRLDLNKNKRPYLYYYTRENILSWDSRYAENDEIFTNLLLRTNLLEVDPESNLPIAYNEVYRHFWINEDGYVSVEDWIEYIDENEQDPIDQKKVKSINQYDLNLTEIPFVMMDIGGSLMEDIGNYQIGLLNLASADLNYALTANFVFYVEQYDQLTEQTFSRVPITPKIDINNPLIDRSKLDAAQRGTQSLAGTSASGSEVETGGITGRRYGKGLNAPDFIAPPSAPMMASMEKQAQMKDELRQIINLAMSNVAPQHASADSKKEDKSGLENGLSGIGLELEYGERRIAKLWAMYENSKEVAEVNYPRKYDVKSDSDRQNEAKSLKDLKGAAPSLTFAKEIGKQIAHTMLSGKVRAEVLIKIDKEIDDAGYITSDAKEIQMDVEAGIVDKTTASYARGYDGKTVVPIAEEEYTERMAQIAAAQSSGVGAARGVGGDPTQSKIEKQNSQNPDTNPTSGGSQTRGPAA